MSDPTPAVARRLAEAAELRAAGASWETIALAVRRRAQICKRWPELYPIVWARLLADASRRLRENAVGESITTLRQLLRSEKEHIQRDAAKLLLAAAPKSPPQTASDADAFIDNSDESDLQQLTDTIAALEGEQRP